MLGTFNSAVRTRRGGSSSRLMIAVVLGSLLIGGACGATSGSSPSTAGKSAASPPSVSQWLGAVQDFDAELELVGNEPVDGRLREDRKRGCEAVKAFYRQYWPEISAVPSASYEHGVLLAKEHFDRAIQLCESFTGLVGAEAGLKYYQEMLEGRTALWGAGEADRRPEPDEAEEAVQPVVATTTAPPEPQDFTTFSVGTCFNEPDEEDLAEVVPCRASHSYEMATIVTLWTDQSRWDRYPGESAVERNITRQCDKAVRSYLGLEPGQTSARYDYVSWGGDEASWEAGDGRVWCTIVTQDEKPSTGSARGARS